MLYFAYGSNMWLEQIARRCPETTYLGRGILYDYVWQINERGLANVVQAHLYDNLTSSSNDKSNTKNRPCVHGLVFDFGTSQRNEQNLDIHEGTRRGTYNKAYLDVELYLAPPQLRVSPENVLAHLKKETGDMRVKEMKRIESGVLVYLSEIHVTPAQIRRFDVSRMAKAVKCALSLGVPRAFIEQFIVPTIPGDLSSEMERVVGLPTGEESEVKAEGDEMVRKV
ncbi:hypothetical protein SBRCBS47491_003251 [Sporothrix bragantina]|uniref:gamma-glutamylcyclotransferase n=1 Tax=Sporothrix bragantina TaxID=671064 RepID=A0ABP0BDX0_9PEZI